MSRSKLHVVALLAAALAWSIGAPARATVMVEVAVEDMIRDADAIVHGVVARSGTRMVFHEGSLEPHTFTTLRVTRWLKGEGGPTVEIDELGGVFQGGGRVIDGTPEYAVGEEVVVFLERRPDRPGYRTYAMVQGKFSVQRGAPGVPSFVRRDLEAVGFARWTGGQMQVVAGREQPAMQLEPFFDLIRDVSAYGGAR